MNATPATRTVRIEVQGTLRGDARRFVLASNDPKAENSLEQPTRVAPVERTVAPSLSGFDLTLEPLSFTVLRSKYSPLP